MNNANPWHPNSRAFARRACVRNWRIRKADQILNSKSPKAFSCFGAFSLPCRFGSSNRLRIARAKAKWHFATLTCFRGMNHIASFDMARLPIYWTIRKLICFSFPISLPLFLFREIFFFSWNRREKALSWTIWLISKNASNRVKWRFGLALGFPSHLRE